MNEEELQQSLEEAVWIDNKERKDMNEDKKLQWSMFAPNQREQYVIRCDNEEEFDRLVTKYKKIIPQEHAFPDDTGNIATPPTNTQQGLGVCEKCGAPLKRSKAGKLYCSNTCWLK